MTRLTRDVYKRQALGGCELSCDLDATSLYDLMGVVGERGILCACIDVYKRQEYTCKYQIISLYEDIRTKIIQSGVMKCRE